MPQPKNKNKNKKKNRVAPRRNYFSLGRLSGTGHRSKLERVIGMAFGIPYSRQFNTGLPSKPKKTTTPKTPKTPTTTSKSRGRYEPQRYYGNRGR